MWTHCPTPWLDWRSSPSTVSEWWPITNMDLECPLRTYLCAHTLMVLTINLAFLLRLASQFPPFCSKPCSFLILKIIVIRSLIQELYLAINKASNKPTIIYIPVVVTSTEQYHQDPKLTLCHTCQWWVNWKKITGHKDLLPPMKMYFLVITVYFDWGLMSC